MAGSTLIHNALILNEGCSFAGSVLLVNGLIREVVKGNLSKNMVPPGAEILDAGGRLLIPGVIDSHVHFREPGLTHKGDIASESRAAVAGGITSFMEMPNTRPPALTHNLLEEKFAIAAQNAVANYSFYFGTSNENVSEVLRTDPRTVCGLKIFLGSSTGNLLVDNQNILNELFAKSKMLIAVHCEDESIIQENIRLYREKYGEAIPVEMHPVIRNEEACYRSSLATVELARRHNTRLHILHLSTAKEMELFDNKTPLAFKRITAEVCVHHLWFSSDDYAALGNRIKWNPAIKESHHREELLKALINNRLDVVGTDHAPHTLSEKAETYFKAPSGAPLVQHSLVAMLELYHRGLLSLETIVEKMCHAPAVCYRLEQRGFIRPGYYADLTLVDLNAPQTVNSGNILYKCGWSPFEGTTFHSTVTHTFVNGNLVWNQGILHPYKAMQLIFKPW